MVKREKAKNHENTENVGSSMKNTLEPAEQRFSAEYVTP